MSERERVLSIIAQCPPMPLVANRLLKILSDPACDLSSAIDQIQSNASLSTTILRMANSPYFGATRSIGNVLEAVLRLGTNQVFKIALSNALSNYSQKVIPGYKIQPRQFLDHSFAVAIIAELLASKFNIHASPYLFTAALLHDVGLIPMGEASRHHHEALVEDARVSRMNIVAFERHRLGIDHADAGAVMLESWHLPPEIVEVVRWHHEPSGCANPRAEIDLVHIADSASHLSGVGIEFVSPFVRQEGASLQRLKLDWAMVEGILGKAQKKWEAWSQSLMSPSGGACDETERACG
jgi:putative nucleotidyltransferase with HDIG domain